MFNPKSLQYLKLPLPLTLAAGLSSVVLLGLVRVGMLALDDIGPWATPLVIIVLVVSSVVSTVNIVALVLERRRKQQRRAELDAKIQSRHERSTTEDIRRLIQDMEHTTSSDAHTRAE
jgi:hypothetical protein